MWIYLLFACMAFIIVYFGSKIPAKEGCSSCPNKENVYE